MSGIGSLSPAARALGVIAGLLAAPPKPATPPADIKIIGLRYAGRDGRGNARTGATTESPTDLAERLYAGGWRDARITCPDGVTVAGVGPALGGGPRIWWAER